MVPGSETSRVKLSKLPAHVHGFFDSLRKAALECFREEAEEDSSYYGSHAEDDQRHRFGRFSFQRLSLYSAEGSMYSAEGSIYSEEGSVYSAKGSMYSAKGSSLSAGQGLTIARMITDFLFLLGIKATKLILAPTKTTNHHHHHHNRNNPNRDKLYFQFPLKSQTERERETTTRTQKTLFEKDCSLGSAKTYLTVSPC